MLQALKIIPGNSLIGSDLQIEEKFIILSHFAYNLGVLRCVYTAVDKSIAQKWIGMTNQEVLI